MTGSAKGFLGDSPYTITIEDVTPEMAQEWLKHMFVRQRAHMPQHSMKIEQGMAMGRYFPHSMICLAMIGERVVLIDGQHRLESIVMHGKPISSPIGRYQAQSEEEIENWYSDIDQGARRSARDAVRAHDLLSEMDIKEKYLTSFGAAIRLIGKYFFEPSYGGGGTTRLLRARASSNAAVVALMRNWRSEAQAYYAMIENGSAAASGVFLRGPVAACAMITLRFAPDRAKGFWETVTKDDGLKQGDPRKAFLDLMSRSGQGIQAFKNRNFHDVIRAFGAAWRAYCEGRELQYIRPTAEVELKYVDLSKIGQSVTECLGVSNGISIEEEVPTDRANKVLNRRRHPRRNARSLFGGPQEEVA